jgi:importin subunit beta-1
MGDLVEILKAAASSGDHNVRLQANEKLEEAVRDQYTGILGALCTEFASEDKPVEGRVLSGLFLKNMVVGQTEETIREKEDRWLQCDPKTRELARQAFMQALMSPAANVGHHAAIVLAAYGKIDETVVTGLLPVVKHAMTSSQVPEKTKIAGLECLGYLCEALSETPETLNDEKTDDILTTIINGMLENCPINMRLAAIGALENTLKFAQKILKTHQVMSEQ